MKKKAILFISLLTLTLLLLSTSVLGQEGNILEDIFGPLFGGLDVNTFYQNYASVIDFIIAFIVFLSISQLTMREKFPGRPGTAISVALAFALSFGFIYFLQQQGVQLRDFGPIAFIVFLLVVGLALYRYFTHWGEGVPGVGALIFVVGYLTTKAIVPGFYEWIGDKVPIVNAILQLVFAGSLVYTFIVLFRLASKSFRGEITEAGKYAPKPELPGAPPTGPTVPPKKKTKGKIPRLSDLLIPNFKVTFQGILRRVETDHGESWGKFIAEMNTSKPYRLDAAFTFFAQAVELITRHEPDLKSVGGADYDNFKNAIRTVESNVRGDNGVLDTKKTSNWWREYKQAINILGTRHNIDYLLRGSHSHEIDECIAKYPNIGKDIIRTLKPKRDEMYLVYDYLLQGFMYFMEFENKIPYQ